MKINHAIRTLIISDLLFTGAATIFAPIFAIFITEQIRGGTIEVVGYGIAIAHITKSILQIPIARYLDKNHGEYDDFISLMLGTVLFVITPFLYLFAETSTHIYLIQVVAGMGLALAVPPWYAIFTRHIDKTHENVEWSLDSVSIGIAGSIAAASGGWLAAHYGFQVVFILAGILAFIGGIIQMKLYSDLKKRVAVGTVQPIK